VETWLVTVLAVVGVDCLEVDELEIANDNAIDGTILAVSLRLWATEGPESKEVWLTTVLGFCESDDRETEEA